MVSIAIKYYNKILLITLATHTHIGIYIYLLQYIYLVMAEVMLNSEGWRNEVEI